MASECDNTAYPKGRKKKIAGLIMFILGIICLVSFLLLVYLSYWDIDALGFAINLFVTAIICGVLALVGLILFIVGWNEGRIQKYREAGDSQADYNDKIDKA